MADLAVIILVRNEAIHLARAIESVRSVAREVCVVDSGSTDGSVEMARKLGAIVLEHPFVNYAKQFSWALEAAPIRSGWVMRLDADEVVEPDLAVEIERELGCLPPDVTGVNLKRKHIFLGRWVRHGGRYPLMLLRIWRRGAARIEDRWMDEHMMLLEGRAVTFNGGFVDHNLNDLTFFTDKHNRYATREAIDIINQRLAIFPRDVDLDRAATSPQAAVKRWVKEKLYNRIPFELSTLMYFVYRYVFQLGFLDGRAGFAYHFLQGYWYRLLVGAKVRELQAALGDSRGADARARLSALTGYPL